MLAFWVVGPMVCIAGIGFLVVTLFKQTRIHARRAANLCVACGYHRVWNRTGSALPRVRPRILSTSHMKSIPATVAITIFVACHAAMFVYVAVSMAVDTHRAWIPIAIVGTGAVGIVLAGWAHYRQAHHVHSHDSLLCLHCGYDLRPPRGRGAAPNVATHTTQLLSKALGKTASTARIRPRIGGMTTALQCGTFSSPPAGSTRRLRMGWRWT
jgi:hypothetical protein